MNAGMPGQLAEQSMQVAAAISRSARSGKKRIAVAESLTSGSICAHLGASEDSASWFLGAVTAYSSEVKFSLLGVERGPVITARCAEQMAAGVARLMGADVALAVTGAGGPGPQEGKPEGTVFIATYCAHSTSSAEHHFSGEAATVVETTTVAALRMLERALHEYHQP